MCSSLVMPFNTLRMTVSGPMKLFMSAMACSSTVAFTATKSRSTGLPWAGATYEKRHSSPLHTTGSAA